MLRNPTELEFLNQTTTVSRCPLAIDRAVLVRKLETPQAREPDPLLPMTFCDLDVPPYPSPSELEIAGEAWLRSPSPKLWRRMIETIQALPPEDEPAALSLVHRLLMDLLQRYQAQAVVVGPWSASTAWNRMIAG